MKHNTPDQTRHAGSECPVCTNPSAHLAGEIQGYRQSTTFKVFHCQTCRVGYVWPMQSDPQLYEHIYKNVQRVPGYARYYRLADDVLASGNPLALIKAREDCYFGVIDHLEKHAKPHSDEILEVGCGQGYLTYSLNQAGYKATGLDISREVIHLARKRYGDHYECGTLESYIGTQSIKPKYVICTELVEHLEDPVGFVQSTLDLMGQDGSLILTTPHKSDNNMAIWDSEAPPVHLWWFSTSSLHHIAERTNSKVQFVSLAEFYKAGNELKQLPGNPEYNRPPIFDNGYQLIAAEKIRSGMRKKIHDIGKAIKRLKLGQRPARQVDLDQWNEANFPSHSLCCVFTKS